MKRLLTALTLVTLLTAPAQAHRAPHPMTANEFRQVLHERDVATARAWQLAQQEAYREQMAELRAEIARGEQENRRLEKIAKAYNEAQSVLSEKPRCPAFAAAQVRLTDEMETITAPASPEAQAFIHHAWAAHRLNHS